MRLFYRALLIAVFPIALGACGQMGGLYMPTSETEAASATAEPADVSTPTPTPAPTNEEI